MVIDVTLDSPVIFRRLDKVVNLRVHQLEYTLFGGLLAISEVFCGFEDNASANRGRRPRCHEKKLKLLTCGFKVFKVDKNLDYLSEILGA